MTLAPFMSYFRLSISFPVTMMYGYEAKSFEEPCISSAHESISLATKLMLHPGTWINIIPALGYVPPWFPGATGSRIAARIRKLTKDIGNIPLEFAKKSVVCRYSLTPTNYTLLKSFIHC